MTGISELFAEFSQPDEFHVQAQMELFAWARRQRNRQRSLRHAERVAQDQARLEARRARQRAWWRANHLPTCAHHSCSRMAAADRTLCTHHLALNAEHARAARLRRSHAQAA